MKQQTKIFLLVALSFLSSFNLSANDTFFSIEKSSDSLEVLANSVDDIIPNLLNKVDNAENAIVSVAKNEQHILDELLLTNGSVTSNGKKFLGATRNECI